MSAEHYSSITESKKEQKECGSGSTDVRGVTIARPYKTERHIRVSECDALVCAAVCSVIRMYDRRVQEVESYLDTVRWVMSDSY